MDTHAFAMGDVPDAQDGTVFLGDCALRCPFCHNAELIDGSAKPATDSAELLAQHLVD